MSLKRNVQKQMRLARPHEGPFREAIAFREAFLRLGFSKKSITVRFQMDAQNPDPSRERVIPVVVVEVPPGFAIQLRNFEVYGSQESTEKLWREWVIELMNGEEDIPDRVTDGFWYKSKVSREGVEAKLREMIVKSGIAIPTKKERE